MQCLAIDPGTDGGAVLRDEKHGVLACYGWKKFKRKAGAIIKLTAHVGNECREYEVPANGYAEIGAIIRADVLKLTRDFVVVVEGQFVGGKNVNSGLEISFKAGLLAAGVLPHARRWWRVKPQVWRKHMYRDYSALKGTDAFKARAVWWSRVAGSQLWTLAGWHDTCEADVMSAYGLQVAGE